MPSPTAENGSVPGGQQHQQQILPILLITSNVGSLFGTGTDQVRAYWLDQMSSTVADTQAVFVALHLQESGGKCYRQHSREMPPLIDQLKRRLDALGFETAHSVLDIDHEAVEQFTALSSLYFVHRSVLPLVSQYNFRHRQFVPSAGGDRHFSASGFVRKEKFPKEFWTNFRWSRKGFLHTRWRIGTKIFDLINIHLFHDESNLNFLENPAEYSDNRRRALQHTLKTFADFNSGTLEGESNLFLFGDFNFRLSLGPLVKRLASQTSEREIVLLGDDGKARGHSVSDTSSCGGGGGLVGGHNSPSPRTDSSEDSGLALTNSSSGGSGNIVQTECMAMTESSSEAEEAPTTGASSGGDDEEEGDEQQLREEQETQKLLMMRRRKSSVIEYYRPAVRELLSPSDDPNLQNTNWVMRIGKKRFDYCDATVLLNEWRAYREDDNELKQYPLKECPLNFPPTYPWSEQPDCPARFMNTRPPAWCDRVVFNSNAERDLIAADPQHCQYRSFGQERCIGDHKPVMLLFTLCPSDGGNASKLA